MILVFFLFFKRIVQKGSRPGRVYSARVGPRHVLSLLVAKHLLVRFTFFTNYYKTKTYNLNIGFVWFTGVSCDPYFDDFADDDFSPPYRSEEGRHLERRTLADSSFSLNQMSRVLSASPRPSDSARKSLYISPEGDRRSMNLSGLMHGAVRGEVDDDDERFLSR